MAETKETKTTKKIIKSTSPRNIKKILDYAVKAREQGLNVNPLFTGEAGLGKSFICQQWVKDQQAKDPKFGFLDLRIAYLEAPDMIGFPEIVTDDNNIRRTKTNLPEFWPTEGKGLLLLEEPNRGNQSIMNCLMQLLTDRKLHNYKLPEGWIIAGCINPENGSYDVNTMDQALKNRFEEYEITYDHEAFMTYVKSSVWHANVASFLNSGTWAYAKSGEVAVSEKYISPRSWEKLNNLERAGIYEDKDIHFASSCSILGDGVGNTYHNFIYEQSPVLAKHLTENTIAALEKLKKQADLNAYRGDLVNTTVESIVQKMPDFPLGIIVDVVKIIPLDHGINLLQKYVDAHPSQEYNLKDILLEFPDLKTVLKNTTTAKRMTEINPGSKPKA